MTLRIDSPEDALVPSSTKSMQPESVRMRISALCRPRGISRPFFTTEQCVMAFLGTVGVSLHMRCILETFSSIFPVLLGLALRRSRSGFPMPLGNCCHAGGRHFRSKPCVELFPCGIHVIWFCCFVALLHCLE